jgi:hypothetical protein
MSRHILQRMAEGDLNTHTEGSRPVPDPTVLTTQALMREVEALRELLGQRIEALDDKMSERLTGVIRVRDEEVRGIEDKLSLVEQQRVEQKKDTKDAVDAALTAQKEAVREQTTASERSIAKSETATTKSIEQLGEKFDTSIDGMRREVADLRERLTTVEQRRVGGQEATASTGAILGYAIGAAGVLSAVVAIIASH